jgi:hypothetical protein
LKQYLFHPLENQKPVIEIVGKNVAKILHTVWGPLNQTILTANEDGTVRIYDARVRTNLFKNRFIH